MKRFLLIPTLLLSLVSMAQHGTITIQANLDSTKILQYSIDTLESYQVGPGIIYTRFDITDSKQTRHCYIYEVDLTNPYNTVEECHHPTIGTTERMVDAHKRLDAPNHRSIGSVNCNFWIVASQEEGQYYGLTGVACTGQVSNGKIGANITNWNIGHGEPDPVLARTQDIGYLMIDSQKRAHIDQFSWDAHCAIGDQQMPINETNRNRKNPADNELVLFNSDLGNRATLTKDAIDANLGTNVPLMEVVVKLDEEWSINKILTATVESINTTGGTIVPEGYAVLRGRGTGKTFLENAKIGEKIQFIIGMCESYSGERPDIKQLSAGNCYVMREGKLTNRNWNEEYNNKNYPRTGFGVSKDHNTLWMMVMEKPGMYTHEMASILRHFGAWEAAGADGGGSAQINLGGTILNPTTESTPRSVGNSIFLFSTAPDDSVVTEMRTATTFLMLPKYAAIKPEFLGYNQYGMLVDKKLPGVQLTCHPETGYITDNGEFVCLGSGIITATYKGISLPLEVVLVEEANPIIRLDSILIPIGYKYPIEISGFVNDKTFGILPSAFDWIIDDPTICMVENGILEGIKDGRTNIHGFIGKDTIHLKVVVETPTKNPLLWENMIQIDNRWLVEPSSSEWNTSFNETENHQAELYIHFTGGGGRSPHILLTADTLLYSTPNKFELRFTPQGETLINKATIVFSPAYTAETTLYEHDNFTIGELNKITIDFSKYYDIEDIATYPIKLHFIKLTINQRATKQEYRIPIEGIYLYYDNLTMDSTPVEQIPIEKTAQKILYNGQLIIINNNKIYNILGHEITEKY